MKNKTDQELLQAYSMGNTKAFEILYERYRRKLYVYAYSLLQRTQEAQDAMHEVFTKLITNISAFKKANNISSFIFAVCRNYCINLMKSKEYNTTRLPEFELLKMSDPVEEAQHNEEIKILNRQIGNLPAKQREILVLKVFGELTFRQISEATRQPQGTVATRYRLATEKLKESLLNIVEIESAC